LWVKYLQPLLCQRRAALLHHKVVEVFLIFCFDLRLVVRSKKLYIVELEIQWHARSSDGSLPQLEGR
jgi:hypothetical protein